MSSPIRISPSRAASFTMPRVSLPLTSPRFPSTFSASGSGSGSLLPLPSTTTSPRRTARRVSYGLKNRISQHSQAVGLGVFITAVVFLVYTFSSSSASSHLTSRLHGWERSSIHPRGAGDHIQYNPGGYTTEYSGHGHAPPGSGSGSGLSDNNGISYLVEDEDELIAEDDLYWEALQEIEDDPEEEKENEAHRLDIQRRDKKASLRALVWYISKGGEFPSDWEVPSSDGLVKMGGRGFEKLLKQITPFGQGQGTVSDRMRNTLGQDTVPERLRKNEDSIVTVEEEKEEEEREDIFEEGWAKFAKKRYRTVVFSKTYCPYSKNAKKILREYDIEPRPYIIELDTRPDTHIIQQLLHHLTGRRTVPNILLDFESIGGSDDLTLIHSEGGLQRKFQEMRLLAGWRILSPGVGVGVGAGVGLKAGRGKAQRPVAAAVDAGLGEA